MASTPPLPKEETPEESWRRQHLAYELFDSLEGALQELRKNGVIVTLADKDRETFDGCDGMPLDVFRRPQDLFKQFCVKDSRFTYRYDDGLLRFSWDPPSPSACPSAGFRLQSAIVYRLATLSKTFSSIGARAVKRDITLSDDMTFDDRYNIVSTVRLTDEDPENASKEISSKIVNHETIRRCMRENPLHEVVLYWNILRNDKGEARFVYFVRDKTVTRLAEAPASTATTEIKVEKTSCGKRVGPQIDLNAAPPVKEARKPTFTFFVAK